jgi:hypothetical protein
MDVEGVVKIAETIGFLFRKNNKIQRICSLRLVDLANAAEE